MSGNLNLPQLTEGQASPEVTVNDATAALDLALTSSFTCDGTSGSVTVTSAQYVAAMRFFITNIGTARNVTLPAIERTVLVDVDSANTAVATLVVGTTSLPLVTGAKYLVFTDGTTNGLTVYAVSSGSAEPYDLSLFIPGIMTNAQLVMRLNVVRAFTLPISLTGSKASAGTASTGTVSFLIKQNGTTIGDVVFTASATATFTFTAAVTFAVGDVITILAPATADATLADVGISLKGSR